MAEYNNPREYREEPLQGTVSSRRVTPEEVAYRDGYVHGRAVVEHDQNPVQTITRQQDVARQRDIARQERRLRTEADNYIASGLVLGLFIALLAGLIGGLMYYFTRESRNEAVIQSQELVPVPTQTQAQNQPVDANIPDVNIVVPTPQTPPSNTVDTTNEMVDDTTTNGTNGAGTTPNGTTTNGTTTNGTTTNGTTTNGTTTNGTNRTAPTSGTTTNGTNSTGTTTNGTTSNGAGTGSTVNGPSGTGTTTTINGGTTTTFPGNVRVNGQPQQAPAGAQQAPQQGGASGTN